METRIGNENGNANWNQELYLRTEIENWNTSLLSADVAYIKVSVVNGEYYMLECKSKSFHSIFKNQPIGWVVLLLTEK